jgi:hypothetical protein
MTPAISISGLSRRYGNELSLDDVTFDVDGHPSRACWAATAPARPPCCVSWPPRSSRRPDASGRTTLSLPFGLVRTTVPALETRRRSSPSVGSRCNTEPDRIIHRVGSYRPGVRWLTFTRMSGLGR